MPDIEPNSSASRRPSSAAARGDECDALESLIARLADEFVEQLDRGQSPDVEDYVARWPGDPRVVRQVLASLRLVRFSSANEPGAAALETVDAAARLGDFQLVREIGRGGMGVVYEARQLSLGRRVALKVLPFAGMLDPRQRQRFQNEAQAAAQLDHPNIINVIGVGCERGVYYYAMRLVDGPTLAEVLRQMRDARGGPNFPQVVAELAAWSPPSTDEEDDADTTLTHHRTSVLASGASQVAPALVAGPSPVAEVTPALVAGSTPRDLAEDRRLSLRERSAALAERKTTMARPPDAPHDAGGTPTPQDADHASRDAAGTAATQPTDNGRAQASTWASRSGTGFYRCVAQVGIQVARALDYAHDVGIVHRDIKPSNLMVDCHGTVWITDFGLARVEANPELTMTGDLLGTIRYMSPEQITGQRAAVDHRADIYSLGATLYELLTGRPAFAGGQRAELLRRVATEPPMAPRKLNRSVPVELETIVLKALEKNPLDRYHTAAEMADDLQRFLDNRPIRARRSPVRGYLKSFWRRHQILLVSVLLTLFVAASVGSLLVWRQWREAVEQRGLVVARDSDLRQRLYAADVKQAHQAWQRGDLTRMKELLDRYAGSAGGALREFAWHYLSSLLAARPAPLNVLRPGHGNIYCVQFSPDGRHLAAACGDGHVQIWSVSDWSLRYNLAAHQSDADCVAFAPDGKLLVSGGEDGWLRLWDVETGELRQSLDAGQKDTLTVAISPDGQTLAAGGIDGMVRLWRLPSGELRDTFRASTGRVQHLAFSPDGQKLATAGGDATAMIFDANTCKQLVSLPSLSQAVFAVAFTASGDELALASATGLVALIDPYQGSVNSLLGVRPLQVRAVAISPARGLLASAGQSGVINVWDRAGRSLSAKLYGHGRRVWSLSFSPDGKLLASGGDDGSVHLWNPAADSGVRQVTNAEPLHHVRFAPDGGHLLAETNNQFLVTWNAATLDCMATVPVAGARQRLAVSTDRRTFVLGGSQGEIWLGDAMSRKLRLLDTGHKSPVEQLALAAEARLVVTFADGVWDVWDTHTNALLDRRQFPSKPTPHPAAMSYDGQLVAASFNNGIILYDVGTLSPRHERIMEGAEFAGGLALSPDNRTLAAGIGDGSIFFIDTSSGERSSVIKSHQHWVDSMAFSPDGRTLASAGRGGVLRLWHTSTREELFTLRRVDSSGHIDIDFSPDGRQLAAATGDRGNKGLGFVWSTAASHGAGQTTGARCGAP